MQYQEMAEKQPGRSSWFEDLFLRYGTASHIFHPLTKTKFWNILAWILIVSGIIGWSLLLWVLH